MKIEDHNNKFVFLVTTFTETEQGKKMLKDQKAPKFNSPKFET